MSLNKAVLALALGASLLMLNVSAEAKNHGGMHKGHSVEHHQMMMDKLGVNDEQRAQMDKLHQERMEAVEAHKKQMHELMQQQHELMQQDTLDKGKLQSNLRKQADIKAEMMAGKHQHHQKVNKVLSEEQRAKMKEMKAQMYQKREHKHEKANQRKQEGRG
ncbi:MAG: periplasmic heavy metal sensor [Kangiella sp.]|jgi:protein CpxP|nr:periplasmic heavy metal sensor [Kangiella sp.]MCW9029799.1 periplasmic heavy metal sensor [Kangiella sp.]